jgi:hypothetical protein
MTALTHFSNQPRAALEDSQSRFRAAGELILDLMREDKLTPTDCKVWTWITTHMATWTRLRDKVQVAEIVKATGAARASISRALKHLTDLGVIHWSPDSQKGSFLSIRELLRAGNVSPRCDTSMSHPDDAPLTSSSNKKKERESEPAPSLPADAFVPETEQMTIPAPSDLGLGLLQEPPAGGGEWEGTVPWGDLVDVKMPADGTETPAPGEPANDDPASGELLADLLSPEEDHEEDARFAAHTLAMHLFQRIPDRWTCQSMYRRFVSLPTGATTQVLDAALLGRPARTIDYPSSYAAEWIRNAERSVMQRQAA